jgi:hypothetical protein
MNHTAQPALSYNGITSNICRQVDLSNEWSSTVVIPNRIDIDQLDISSAAMGDLSTTPVHATKQPYQFPRYGKCSSVFRFDPDLYGENSWPQLHAMLTTVGCVNGCRLVVHRSYVCLTGLRKRFYKLKCTHGIAMENKGSSIFMNDNVGPSNVKRECMKRGKTSGAIRGKVHVVIWSNVHILPIRLY